MNASRKLKPSGLPRRPLSPALALGLGAAVALVHLWLLAQATLPLGLSPATAPTAPRLSTRHIDAPPATTPAVAAVRRPAERPAPPTSVSGAPTEAPTPAATAPAEAAPVQEAAAGPAPTASPPAEASAPPPASPQASPQASAQVHLPGSARLRYALSGKARGLNYLAEGELTWQQDGRHYEARMLISGLLLARPRLMTSVGDLGEQGVVPRRFSDKARTELATHFQPERGRIVFSSNAPEAAWQPGTQDRVSLFFQLAGLLAAEPGRHVPGTQVQLLTAGTREADTWTFTVTGTPTLDLPAGSQPTIALRREPRREYDQTLEIWFAPALAYLPVRIRITQGNGDVIDQKLAAVEPL